MPVTPPEPVAQYTELLGNLGQFLQAVLIPISLYFVLRQLRQQERESRNQNELIKVANTSRIMQLLVPFDILLIQNREVAEFWEQGADKYHTYDEVDKTRYSNMVTWWLLLHENIFLQFRNGYLDRSVYEAWTRDLDLFVERQKMHSHWWKYRIYLADDFRDYMDQKIHPKT